MTPNIDNLNYTLWTVNQLHRRLLKYHDRSFMENLNALFISRVTKHLINENNVYISISEGDLPKLTITITI